MKGVIIFTIISFLFALLITILDKVLNKRKSKIDMIEELLPGYNCGACGYGSCMGLACELVKDIDLIEKCKVATDEVKHNVKEYYEK